MLKNLVFLVVASALALGAGYADQPTAKTTIPVNRTPANDGKQMYVNYCAPCHGVDGKGNGPAAGALKQQPADLSLLSKKNGGKYPTVHVISILKFGAENPAHGNAQMPVWGPVLGRMDASATQASGRELRISNLTGYIQSLQAQ